MRYQKGSSLMADLLTKPITQVGSWKRFWAFLAFWLSDECKGAVYEAEDIRVNEVRESETERLEKTNAVKLQVAKIGSVLGLVESARSFGSERRMVSILCFVLAILFVHFLVELKQRMNVDLLQPVSDI